MAEQRQPAKLTRSWWWLLLIFSMIGRRRLRKSFRAVRMMNVDGLRNLSGGPVVIYLNHPSWWDPIVCAELARRLLPGRKHRAPISAASLKQYKFFRNMGMFPVEQDSPRGAVQFLRAATSVLAADGVLWITAQGHFTDVRVRPTELKSGLGALLQRSENVTVIPLAVEYTFWNQRLPEVLLAVGTPMYVSSPKQKSAAEWTQLLQGHLEATQDRLQAASIGRDASAFTTLLQGRRGTAGPYGWWQRTRAQLRGEIYQPDHLDGSIEERSAGVVPLPVAPEVPR
ncbi:MAG: lysophospholipid acyltransferase family protein [Janthinobacterium lividum]